jgi:outer membrane protein TolC
MERHLESVRARYNEGLAPRFDLLRAEVQLENFRPRLAQVERNIALSRETLALQLKVSSDSLPPLTGAFAFKEISVDQDRAIEQALRDRPEVAALDHALVAARQGSAVSSAGYKPQLSLALNYSLQEGFDDEPDNNWSAEVSLRWTLFDGGGTRAAVREAQAFYEQTRIERENLEDRIELEVKQSVINLHNRKAEITTQQRTVELSREALTIADERYKSGLLAHNEYLDAQLDLVEARTNYLKALSDYLVAGAEYERVVGTGGEHL